MQPHLFSHQITALEFLRDGLAQNINRAHLDPAGTGKTLPALLASREFTDAGKICLWITLASAKFQLADEIARFSIDFRPFVLVGDKTTRLNAITALEKPSDDVRPTILIVNYEQVLAHGQDLARLPISMIVADECTRLGNQKNKTWKMLYALAKFTKARKLALSGTPITNSPLEAWPLFEYLNPGSLGRWFSFAADYMARTQYSMFGRIKMEMLPHLAARLAPYYIRREREQLLPDLPDLLEETVPVELSASERKLYDQLKMELLFDIEKVAIDKIENPQNIQMGIVKFGKLRMLCVNPALLGSGNTKSAKLAALQEFISTIGESKALIFTEFASAVPGIMAVLPEGSAVSITGAVQQEKRAAIIEKFQTDPACRYLVGTKAVEMALNLQAADFVIHIDPPLTYASYDQRVSRARRQGRADKVVSVRLVCRGTIEERIYKMIEKKKDISLAAMPYSDLVRELL